MKKIKFKAWNEGREVPRPVLDDFIQRVPSTEKERKRIEEFFKNNIDIEARKKFIENELKNKDIEVFSEEKYAFRSYLGKDEGIIAIQYNDNQGEIREGITTYTVVMLLINEAINKGKYTEERVKEICGDCKYFKQNEKMGYCLPNSKWSVKITFFDYVACEEFEAIEDPSEEFKKSDIEKLEYEQLSFLGE